MRPPSTSSLSRRARERTQGPSADAQSNAFYNDETLFDLFTAALSEPSIADAACRLLLGQFLGADVMVHWSDLQRLDPLETLGRAVIDGAVVRGQVLRRPVQNDAPEEYRAWWHAFLQRYGLYGDGDAITAEEFGELLVAAFRTLRDCCAQDSYLQNLKTVRRDTQRLKDRYSDFEFAFRGSLGKCYRCRSRLTREESACRQIRKDRVAAPTDHLRSEIELLRNIEHSSIPRVVASFEDFNSAYVVTEAIDGVELIAFLQQQHTDEKQVSEGWLVQVWKQILEALRHCHEQRPHSIVHGDLRLESVLLASGSSFMVEPNVVLTDLGLAGLLPRAPLLSPHGNPRPVYGFSSREIVTGHACTDELQPPSPKRDVWSCGCMLYIILTGRHPLGNDDLRGRLLPPTSGADCTLEAFAHSSGAVASLCEQMLTLHVRKRPSARECMGHPWLSLASSEHELMLLSQESQSTLTRDYAATKLRQVVCNLIVSELSNGPFACVGPMLNALDAGSDSKVPAKVAAEELRRLGISESSIEKVLPAFDSDGSGFVSLKQFAVSCAELAEDRLDHALWRVFTAVGEEHRGVVGARELEQVLSTSSGSSGGSDWAGGAEHYIRGVLDPGLTAAEIIQYIAEDSNDIHFDALKEFVVRRQREACHGLEPLMEGPVDEDHEQLDSRVLPQSYDGDAGASFDGTEQP